ASAFFPEIVINTSEKEFKIKFPAYNSVFDFSNKADNKKADSLIDKYLSEDSTKKTMFHRRSLSEMRLRVNNNNLTNLQNDGSFALDNFFYALLKEKNDSIVRISHYGDSQLEGDRITCVLRNNFQNKFGGAGVGFVAFNDIADNMNLSRYSSPNWNRYTVFHNRYGSGYYGLSGNVYKFSRYAIVKHNNDSVSNNDSSSSIHKAPRVFQNATVSITLNPYVKFSNISLMYGRSSSKCLMNIYDQANNEKISSDSLITAEGFTFHNLKISSSVRSFTMEFTGNVSPDFYGLLIDGKNGVQIDNYSIRGHSGDGLLLINPEYLAAQLKKLKVRLVIFQYGNNVVPYVNSDEKCKQLEQMYFSIFKRFKNAAPNLSILVIGVSDMATMYNGSYNSYPFIPKIRDAQKNAALKAGCAFWDIFEVMGGQNSILTWTNKKLASYDGHFSLKGEKLIGNELFNALMIEYNQYKLRQRKKEAL
ncbi:MAG: hypothetical protein HGB12_14850, partial [Bacteroidetes bacterium]|nr:hypothetical protein [Bacteroidota bacterium]